VPEDESGDALVAAFAQWAAGQRVDAAVAGRARERSLREQAGAGATWTGVLLDLAERGAPVAIAAPGGRRRGRIVGVGPDFCVVALESGRPSLIALDALTQIWPDPDRAGARPDGGLAAGDREPALGLSFAAALAMLAEERSPVTLVTGAGEAVTGILIGAGEDVLTLQTDPPGRRIAHLPLGAVAACELR